MRRGLIVKPNITEKDLTELVSSAYKNGCAFISAITPRNQLTRLKVIVERTRGFDLVEIDTHSYNWNISEEGQRFFTKLARDFPDGIKDPYCGKHTMGVSVKHSDKEMWGVGLWLTHMLKVLEKSENLEEV